MKPIQDVVPPNDSLGNPVNHSIAPQTPHNPIAGTALAQSPSIDNQTAEDHTLDGLLMNVTASVKNHPGQTPQPKPAKRGMFGFFKKKSKPAPQQPKPAGSPNPAPLSASPVSHQPVAPPQLSNSQLMHPQQNHPAGKPLNSGPVRPKSKSKFNLPAAVAVIVAIVLVAVALSAFKN